MATVNDNDVYTYSSTTTGTTWYTAYPYQTIPDYAVKDLPFGTALPTDDSQPLSGVSIPYDGIVWGSKDVVNELAEFTLDDDHRFKLTRTNGGSILEINIKGSKVKVFLGDFANEIHEVEITEYDLGE